MLESLFNKVAGLVYSYYKIFGDELAGLPETVNSIFNILEYLRVRNNDFGLIGHGIYCNPVLIFIFRPLKLFFCVNVRFYIRDKN